MTDTATLDRPMTTAALSTPPTVAEQPAPAPQGFLANVPAAANIVNLTPELAAELLKVNVCNRPMRKHYVDKLAEAIARGEWDLNGDAVRVSVTGKLLDGQHRCAAVVKSGMTVPTLLVTGLEDRVFATIDRGLGRTTSDTLSIRGVSNSSMVAAITRLLHIHLAASDHDPYNGNPTTNPTAKQQMDLLERHPSIQDAARWAASAKWSRKYMPPSFAGFIKFLFTDKDQLAAESFFTGLESGVGLAENSPVLHLRNRYIDYHADSKGKVTPSYRAGLAFKAFKLHRDGASIKTLRVRTEGDAAEKDIFVL